MAIGAVAVVSGVVVGIGGISSAIGAGAAARASASGLAIGFGGAGLTGFAAYL